MSGGYFDHDQYTMERIADSIENLIYHNGSSERDPLYGNTLYESYSKDVVEQFKIAVNKIKEAAVYAQRIDWLVSGDDGEGSFLIRLNKDLENLRLYDIGD